MDKQILVYSCKGILLSNKKKLTNITHTNMNDSQKYYAEQKKPHKRLYTVFIGHSGKQKSNSNRQQIKWLPGITGRWQSETTRRYRGTFG